MRLFQVMSQVIPNDRHLEHDGGGVDGDEDEGGEDHLGVAGLEAVHHEGAEHHGEDGFKKNVGDSEAVPCYKWGYVCQTTEKRKNMLKIQW